MGRPFQFSLRALLVFLLAIACFFAGVRFERDRRRRANERAAGEHHGWVVFRRTKDDFKLMTGGERQKAVLKIRNGVNQTGPRLVDLQGK